jgi:hypothetical protein
MSGTSHFLASSLGEETKKSFISFIRCFKMSIHNETYSTYFKLDKIFKNANSLDYVNTILVYSIEMAVSLKYKKINALFMLEFFKQCLSSLI